MVINVKKFSIQKIKLFRKWITITFTHLFCWVINIFTCFLHKSNKYLQENDHKIYIDIYFRYYAWRPLFFLSCVKFKVGMAPQG